MPKPKLGQVMLLWFALIMAIVAWEGNIGKMLAAIFAPGILEVKTSATQGNASNATTQSAVDETLAPVTVPRGAPLPATQTQSQRAIVPK